MKYILTGTNGRIFQVMDKQASGCSCNSRNTFQVSDDQVDKIREIESIYGTAQAFHVNGKIITASEALSENNNSFTKPVQEEPVQELTEEEPVEEEPVEEPAEDF